MQVFFAIRKKAAAVRERDARYGIRCGTQCGIQCGIQNGTYPGQNVGHINKQNINKTKQKRGYVIGRADAPACKKCFLPRTGSVCRKRTYSEMQAFMTEL